MVFLSLGSFALSDKFCTFTKFDRGNVLFRVVVGFDFLLKFLIVVAGGKTGLMYVSCKSIGWTS